MRSREFLSKLEHDRIVHAIREGESNTSGEIRVYVQRGKLKADPLIVAQKKFQRLQMHKTQQRNAVLIFVAPREHKFAVVGDKAIHEKCGDEFWPRIFRKCPQTQMNYRTRLPESDWQGWTAGPSGSRQRHPLATASRFWSRPYHEMLAKSRV